MVTIKTNPSGSKKLAALIDTIEGLLMEIQHLRVENTELREQLELRQQQQQQETTGASSDAQ